jgi:hypothetical protein
VSLLQTRLDAIEEASWLCSTMSIDFVLPLSMTEAEYAIQQFRITTWPGLLPHPQAGNPLGWTLSDDGVLAPAAVGALLMLHEVPDLEVVPLLRAHARVRKFDKGDADEVSAVGEIYLELADLDLDDERAILNFVRRFGVLGVAHEHFALFRTLPGFDSEVLARLAAAWPTERFNQSVEDYLERRGDGPNTTLVETLEEFRFGARVLRDLLTAARVSQLAEPPTAIGWKSIPEDALTAKRAELADYGVELDGYDEAIDIFLRGVLTEGLRPFHPRVLNADDPADSFVDAPLYAVCCLELFNHLVEHVDVKVCANETCGRQFARQRGRAEHGQHRTRGVKFCSNQCARAQMQRAYRRRLRATPASDPDTT